MKLDLHVHTIFSKDSLIKPEDAVKIALKKGLDGLAICDHNTLKAYRILKKKRFKDIIIIPGVEIETHIGEVMGLFIEEEIKTKNNNFFTIVNKIKDNNGLVVIPHPFDFLRSNHLKLNLLNDNIIKKYIDGIEIMNSRIIMKSCVRKARKFNEKYQLFETGGSDAHTPKEIGNGYTLIQGAADISRESIYECLVSKKSKSCGHISSPFVHAITVFNKFQKGLYF
jgi:predicted metal-dependent phosphoesterase TrpH